MASIQVPRNTFYKKQTITTGVTLKPQFPDLPSSSDVTFELNQGTNTNLFVLSGTIPDIPSYGDATLGGGFLRTYVSGVNYKNTRTTPNIMGYLLQPRVTLAEGGFSLANRSGSSSGDVVGNQLAVYSSVPVNDIPYMQEEFEGAVGEFQSITRMGGNNQITYSDPYIPWSALKAILKAEGFPVEEIKKSHMRNFQTRGYAEPSKQPTSATGIVNTWLSPRTFGRANSVISEAFVNQWGSGAILADNANNVPAMNLPSLMPKYKFGTEYLIKFEGEGKYFRLIPQSWPQASSGLKGKNLKGRFSTSKYAGFIDWGSKESAAGNYEEGSAEANKGNTIFRDLYATRDFSNPYDANDNDPMLNTVMELSSEKSLNGGQSFRVYHNWGYSELNPEIQNLVVTSGNLNPQCARASLFNIPFPKMPFEIGQSTYNGGEGGSDTTGDQRKMRGDTRGVVPEINIGMNITKLAPTILLNLPNSTNTNYASGRDFYKQSDVSASTLPSNSQTFLRTVAITFSNYKPKDDHVTLDDFLSYGMSRFYGDSTYGDSKVHTTENIVGGIVFSRFGIDGTSSTEVGQNIFAFPLAVTQPSQITGNSLMRLTGVSGNAAPMGSLINLNTMSWGVTNVSGGPDQDGALRFVQLPMNAWFNCKVYTDVMAYNNTGSISNKPFAPSGTNKSYGDVRFTGVMMRAMFETQAGNPYVSGTLKNPDTQDIPFIDIPFPAGNKFNATDCAITEDGLVISSLSSMDGIRVGQTITGTDIPPNTVVTTVGGSTVTMSLPYSGGTTTTHTVTFDNYSNWNLQDNPEFYPKHMTMWVQNYPWISGANGTDFQFGDSAVAESGAAREAEVFFDSVTLKNYSPQVSNLQADAIDGSFNLKPTSHFSPIGMMTSGSTKFKKGWVGSPQLDTTALCRVTEGSTTVSILGASSNITTYELQNAGTVSVVGSGYIPASTDIASITDLETFELDAAATASGDITVSFNSLGILRPPINRGELNSYNSGYNICMGWDDKGDLPISAGGGLDTFDAGVITGTNSDGTFYVTSTKYSVAPDTATSNGTLKVVVAGGGASATVTVSGAAIGESYSVSDTFTILGSAVGGLDVSANISVDVASVTAPFANDSNGYILCNDFNTLDFANLNRVIPNKNRMNTILSGGLISKVTGSQSSGFRTLGSDLMGSPVVDTGTLSGSIFISGTSSDTNLIIGGYKVAVNAGAAKANQISLGTTTNNSFISCDGFTQKGFLRAQVSDTNTGLTNYADWAKRENVMVCTKIVNIPQMTNFDKDPDNNMPQNAIVVEDSSIFNPSNESETYRIFKMGEIASSTNYKGGLKINTSAPIEDNRVEFTTQCSIASDNVTQLLNEDNISQLYIGPEKYWISMLFDTPADLAPRNYGALCTVNETPSSSSSSPVSGSTLNEFTYTFDEASVATLGSSALYKRTWDLSSMEDEVYLLGDYGYGPYDEETGAGGNVLQGPAFLEEYNYYNVGGLISNGAGGGDSVPIILSLWQNSEVSSGVTLYGDEYTTDTTKCPTFYWQFSDLPPAIGNFSVKPAINLIDGSGAVDDLYDLTTENLNAVNFTWSEAGDDIWYRLLMIDNIPIIDKYHKATMWLPMNESVVDVSAAPSYTVHNPSASVSGATTVGSTIRAVIEGQAGWAPVLDSSADTGQITVANATNYTNLKDLEEFTLVLHWTPSLADRNTVSYIATATTAIGTAAGNFELYKDANNNVICNLGADIAMTGSSSVLCDGDVPTNIIITFNKNASSAVKARLFIDGIMVANSTGSTEQTTTADFVVGGVYSASYRGTTGMIEEVVLYSKAYEVPEESNSYVMNTVDILDQDGTRDVTHNARLFAADYHNFRGVSAQEIGMSGYTSWRCTTL